MFIPVRRTALLALAAATAAPVSSILAAEPAYPTRPITIVVPFPPGGPTDVIARFLAEEMRATLGQPVVIENLGGAGGSIGAGKVARAQADGYTLVMANSGTHVFNGALYNLSYDLVANFEPVALVARESLVIVGKKSLPANTLREFVAWLRNNPNALQSTPGVGTPPHLGGMLFQKASGVRAEFVQYRGAAPAMLALMAEQVDFDITSPVTTLPQIRAGAIKGYAVASNTRLTAAPDLPSVDEAGLPGFHAGSWFALFAPRGVPQGVCALLNRAIVTALAHPDVRQRLNNLGMEIFAPEHLTAQALGALQKSDIEKWWPIIKHAGIRIE